MEKKQKERPASCLESLTTPFARRAWEINVRDSPENLGCGLLGCGGTLRGKGRVRREVMRVIDEGE